MRNFLFTLSCLVALTALAFVPSARAEDAYEETKSATDDRPRSTDDAAERPQDLRAPGDKNEKTADPNVYRCQTSCN